MNVKSRHWAVGLAGLLLAAGLSACVEQASGDPTTTPPSTQPPGEQPIADGEHFAFVSVGTDESGEITLGIDLAEMLTGEEARQAAIDEGFIEDDEELDTDFYISNPERVAELVHVAPDAEITVISGNDTSQQVPIDAETLEALYEGTYTGDPVYGIAAGEPIAMDLVIEEGLVTEAHAIYLP